MFYGLVLCLVHIAMKLTHTCYETVDRFPWLGTLTTSEVWGDMRMTTRICGGRLKNKTRNSVGKLASQQIEHSSGILAWSWYRCVFSHQFIKPWSQFRLSVLLLRVLCNIFTSFSDKVMVFSDANGSFWHLGRSWDLTLERHETLPLRNVMRLATTLVSKEETAFATSSWISDYPENRQFVWSFVNQGSHRLRKSQGLDLFEILV